MSTQRERQAEDGARAAHEAIGQAQRVYAEAVKHAFPIGRHITYAHGHNLVPCEVIGYGWQGDLRVRGTSGKEYIVSAFRALYK